MILLYTLEYTLEHWDRKNLASFVTSSLSKDLMTIIGKGNGGGGYSKGKCHVC